MLKRLVGFGLLVLLTVGISGCPGPTLGLVVTEGDDGGIVTIPLGNTLTVELSSTPSSEEAWSVTAFNSAVLRQTGHQVIPPTSSAAGAAGKERFEFQAIATGSSAVSLAYARTDEPNAPADRTFSVTVNVSNE